MIGKDKGHFQAALNIFADKDLLLLQLLKFYFSAFKKRNLRRGFIGLYRYKINRQVDILVLCQHMA